MAVPKDIPDFGSSEQKVALNPEFDPTSVPSITSEDYFVLSRVDGRTSLRELVLMSGFAAAKGIEILRKLRRSGALLLPGETPSSVAALVANVKEPAPRPADQPMVELGELTEAEQAAMAEEVDLSHTTKLRVIGMVRLLERANLFELLGVEPDADKRELKHAYFRLSKEFHPDRFYNKKTGSFGPWLARIFESASRAYEILRDPRRRQAYEARLRGAPPPQASPRTQTKKEHAAHLYDRACGHEVKGELSEAMKVFAAVLRIYPTARYYRRAATCAMKAQDLDIAEDYASKAVELAPEDPSYFRVLADVYRAARQLQRAEEVLIRAAALKTENDVLARELQADLEQVRDSLRANAASRKREPPARDP